MTKFMSCQDAEQTDSKSNGLPQINSNMRPNDGKVGCCRSGVGCKDPGKDDAYKCDQKQDQVYPVLLGWWLG